MLLVVDVGNTNIVLGLYHEQALLRHWRIATRVERTGDEYGILVANLLHLAQRTLDDIHGVIIASVVPPIQAALTRCFRRVLHQEPLIVGPSLATGMDIRYDHPQDVGADRIVNAVAAYDRVQDAAIVVDFGTAITFDLISPEGAYLGGAIAPGLGLAMDALFEKTAKLPRVALARPPRSVGTNTAQAMQSGVFWGYVALVDGLLERIIAEVGLPDIQVLATGGLARLMAGECRRIGMVDEMLTLTGLRLLYERNQ
jgi:type III pantothenate kinase